VLKAWPGRGVSAPLKVAKSLFAIAKEAAPAGAAAWTPRKRDCL